MLMRTYCVLEFFVKSLAFSYFRVFVVVVERQNPKWPPSP